MLFNWKVLLGLTAHGRQYLAELIERRHVHLAALAWSVSETAFKRYNVATYEMYLRALQVAYVDFLDPKREREELVCHPLRSEELPVFIHHYGEQCVAPALIAAVKATFDNTYAPLSDSQERVIKTVGKKGMPQHISMIYMERIRGQHDELSSTVVQPDYRSPSFGPLKPGQYLHELLYANAFRYRYGGVSVLQRPVVAGKTLPSALVIDFNQFIPYRFANMGFYNKLRGNKRMSVYDMALVATEVFRKHYYGVMHNKNIGAYYELLAKADPPVPSDSLAVTFIMPIPVLRSLTEQARKYGVNHLVGVSTRAKSPRGTGARRSRRNVSAKSILTVLSPATPYLVPSEFRLTHRYNNMLVSPPWPLTMANVRAYFQEERLVHVAEHMGRVYAPLHVLRRIPPAQDYMTPELDTWLKQYEQMNKYIFKEEIKMNGNQGINKLVREDYGAEHLRFRPEEDDVITRLYRPTMSADDEAQLKATCFGRSLRSISLRAGILRHEMLSQGIYDLTQLPHGQRSESLLLAIRKAKKKEARHAARREKEERKAAREAAKRAAEQPEPGAEVVPVP
jgi:hypothetical protein